MSCIYNKKGGQTEGESTALAQDEKEQQGRGEDIVDGAVSPLSTAPRYYESLFIYKGIDRSQTSKGTDLGGTTKGERGRVVGEKFSEVYKEQRPVQAIKTRSSCKGKSYKCNQSLKKKRSRGKGGRR